MGEKNFICEKKGAICRLSFNAPETLNAVTIPTTTEIIELLRKIGDDETVKVVVITGTGRAFSAGGDVSSMLGETAITGRRRLKTGQQLVRTLCELEKPIIAAVNGITAGAGVSIALACDMIIASEKARFVLSQIRIGLPPDWGLYYLLTLRIGVARTKELMLLGDQIEAREAERIGMVNRVVSHEKLEIEVMSVAEKLASGPTVAYAMAKMAMNRWPASFESLLELESAFSGIALGSEDAKEGCRAFLEKREPRYQGK